MEGHITWLHDFRAAFAQAMDGAAFVCDVAVLNAAGYQLSADRVNVCKHCKQHARANCCPQGNRIDRCKKDVIHNMRMTGL